MFILGKRLTEHFKQYEGMDDEISFGNFDDNEKLVPFINPTYNKKYCVEDEQQNFKTITFGSFENNIETLTDKFRPSFGSSFKCGVENIERIDRITLGNMLLINKMLFLNKDINTHIFDKKEKKIIQELKKKLNRVFTSYYEYELNISVLLNDRSSVLNKYLILNEKMLFEHYEEEYEKIFKNLPKEYVVIEKEKLQYIIREKTLKEPHLMIKPINNKYYGFKEKELELYSIFLNNQRNVNFKNEIEYFDWFRTNGEILLLKKWNFAWLLHRNIEILKANNDKKYKKNIEDLDKDLEEINLELGRNNEDYLFV
jgi:hypothetical protein